MNILIVKLSAIGDVIHTMPALVALRQRYPEAHISWLVEEAGAEVLQGHPALDQLLIWRRRELQSHIKRFQLLKAIGALSSSVIQLRKRRYDLVIDFQGLLKSGIAVLISRGDRKVGFGRGMEHSEGSYLFLNKRVPVVSMEVHALERGLRLLEAIGVPRGELNYKFPHDAKAEAEVDNFLGQCGVTGETPLVVIHPMTRWRTKLWFNERFAALADALQAQGFIVVFSGSSSDTPQLDEIERVMKSHCNRFDGLGGLRHLAALCRRARVMISTDTGPMHLAAAVGTQVVALFGPTAPNRTGPYGREHKVIHVSVPCSPCFKRRCESTVVEEFGCMKRIEVGQVLDVVLGIVGENDVVRRNALKPGTFKANAHS